MSENSSRALWCLIAGDSAPFEVDVPADVSISRLKKHIFEEAGPVKLHPMVARDLELWEVRHLHTPANLPVAYRSL